MLPAWCCLIAAFSSTQLTWCMAECSQHGAGMQQPCSFCSWVQWAIKCFLLCFLLRSEHSLTLNHSMLENLLFDTTDLVCSSTITTHVIAPITPSTVRRTLPTVCGADNLLFVTAVYLLPQKGEGSEMTQCFPYSLMLRFEELHHKQSSAL